MSTLKDLFGSTHTIRIIEVLYKSPNKNWKKIINKTPYKTGEVLLCKNI